MSEEFGNRLKKCLKDAGYTQIKATEELKLSKNAILNYTKGRIPEAKILYELSKLCNVSMEYLLIGKEDKSSLNDNEIEILNKFKLLNNYYKNIADYKIQELIKEQNEKEKQDKEEKFQDIG